MVHNMVHLSTEDTHVPEIRDETVGIALASKRGTYVCKVISDFENMQLSLVYLL